MNCGLIQSEIFRFFKDTLMKGASAGQRILPIISALIPLRHKEIIKNETAVLT